MIARISRHRPGCRASLVRCRAHVVSQEPYCRTSWLFDLVGLEGEPIRKRTTQGPRGLQLLRPDIFALHSRPTLAIHLMPRQARDQISLPVPEYVWPRKACLLERSLRLWAWHDTGYSGPSTSFLRARGPNNVAKRSATDHGQRLSSGEVQQCNGTPRDVLTRLRVWYLEQSAVSF
jgi:hypothetical protein